MRNFIIIALIFSVVLVGFLTYSQTTKKKAVATCSELASKPDNELIKDNVLKLQNANATPKDIETYVQRALKERSSQTYDLLFKSCMGTNGYEVK